MNRKQLQKLKGLFVQGLFALVIAAPSMATANTIITIKNTNYPIPNNAYFVAPNGKETNSGQSADSPWTVAKALSAAPSGATIVFRGGEYRSIQSLITKKLILQAYPNEKPLLKGSDIVTGWVNEGDIWRKDGWNYSFPSTVSNQYIDPRYPMAGHRDMVYINGTALKQAASKAEVGSGKFYVDAANNRLYIGENPSGKIVEATNLTRAFTLWISRHSNPSDAVIRGLGFAHYADEAILIGAPRVTLENNTFSWSGQRGAAIFSPDVVVNGNTFSYNGRQGLFGMKAHRMQVKNNIITNNNIENFNKHWDASGVKSISGDDVVFRGNLVANNNSSGIWIDVSSTNATVVNNIVHTNTSNGIFFEISHKAIIASNVAYQNYPAGIMILNASNARIYNNTLAQNHANLLIKETPRNNSKTEEISQGITWITRNNIIKNNILWNSSGPMFFAPGCETKEPSNLMINIANYNAYYRQSASKSNNHVWSTGSRQCSVAYKTLSIFNSATGMEENGLESINSTDPFFIDADAQDFRLKSGSLAINRGEALPSDIADAIGVPSGVRVNLGAFESQLNKTHQR